MGLDIVVHCTPSDVIEALEYDNCGVKDRELAKAVIKDLKGDSIVSTRPGSYGGLHVVRDKFTTFKGIDPEPLTGFARGPIPKSHQGFHLLNHSDCDGWYLPDKFETPVWAGGTSIGSSFMLLSELEEITPLKSDDWFWRWAAVYAAAVASVTQAQPIKFC